MYSDKTRKQFTDVNAFPKLDIWARATQNGLLIPYFQPITDKKGALSGFEVLARKIENGRLISPSEHDFISGSEEQCDLAMLRYACVWLNDAHNRGTILPHDFVLSVNLSPITLAHISPDKIHDIIEHHGVERRLIQFELLEAELVQDRQGRTLNSFIGLGEAGHPLVMDDFVDGPRHADRLAGLLPHLDGIKLDKPLITYSLGGIYPIEYFNKILLKRSPESPPLKIIAEQATPEQVRPLIEYFGVTHFQSYPIGGEPISYEHALVRSNAYSRLPTTSHSCSAIIPETH